MGYAGRSEGIIRDTGQSSGQSGEGKSQERWPVASLCPQDIPGGRQTGSILEVLEANPSAGVDLSPGRCDSLEKRGIVL